MTVSQPLPTPLYKQSCIEQYIKTFSSSHTADQQQNAIKDIQAIFDNFLAADFSKAMEATLVIGPKGAGKTLFSTYAQEKHASWGSRHVYLSSDHLCQHLLKNTCLNEPCKQPLEAWRVWKPLADHITQFLQKEALAHRCSILAEADPTDPFLSLLLKALKEHSYAVKIILLTAPEDIRRKSFKEPLSAREDDRFYEQAQAFSLHTTSLYLEAADEVEFYLRNRLDTKPSLAATWVKSDFRLQSQGSLYVFDESLFEATCRVHDLTLQYFAESQGQESFTCWKDLLSQHTLKKK